MELLEALASQLRLKEEHEGKYSGIHQGYPVAVSTFGGADGEHWGLLFQVRHPCTSDELPDEQQYHWHDVLEDRIRRDVAKVDVEERIAWLSIFDVEPQVPPESIIDMLNALLAGLQSAGIKSVGETCHYCLQAPGKLHFIQGRVLQICNACLEKHFHERAVLVQATRVGIVQAWVWGVAAAALGAILWAGFWFTYGWVMSWLSGGRGGVLWPTGFWGIVAALGIGALVGVPVGYVLRRIPNRGAHAAKVAIGCVLAGTLLGEALLAALWVYHIEGVLAFGLRFLWAFWRQAGLAHLALKAAAAGLGVCIAYELAKVETRPI